MFVDPSASGNWFQQRAATAEPWGAQDATASEARAAPEVSLHVPAAVAKAMIVRYILAILANNEKLVQRLSESYPMRRAAQLVAIAFFRGKFMIEDTKLHKLTPEQFRDLIGKISDSFRRLKKP